MRQKMLHAYDDVHVVRLQIASRCCECDIFKANHMTWYWCRLVKKKRFVFGSNHFILHFIFVAVIRYDFLGISISFHGKSFHVFQPISIVYIWFRLIWIRIWRHYLIKLRKSKRKNAISMKCALFRSQNWHRKMWIISFEFLFDMYEKKIHHLSAHSRLLASNQRSAECSALLRHSILCAPCSMFTLCRFYMYVRLLNIICARTYISI